MPLVVDSRRGCLDSQKILNLDLMGRINPLEFEREEPRKI